MYKKHCLLICNHSVHKGGKIGHPSPIRRAGSALLIRNFLKELSLAILTKWVIVTHWLSEGSGEPAAFATTCLTNFSWLFLGSPLIGWSPGLNQALFLFYFSGFLRWTQLSRCARAMDVRLAFSPASDRRSDLDGITATRGRKTSLREIKRIYE